MEKSNREKYLRRLVVLSETRLSSRPEDGSPKPGYSWQNRMEHLTQDKDQQIAELRAEIQRLRAIIKNLNP